MKHSISISKTYKLVNGIICKTIDSSSPIFPIARWELDSEMYGYIMIDLIGATVKYLKL
jgi:hypothetical protein